MCTFKICYWLYFMSQWYLVSSVATQLCENPFEFTHLPTDPLTQGRTEKLHAIPCVWEYHFPRQTTCSQVLSNYRQCDVQLPLNSRSRESLNFRITSYFVRYILFWMLEIGWGTGSTGCFLLLYPSKLLRNLLNLSDLKTLFRIQSYIDLR